MKPTHRIIVGDVRAVLGSLPERSVQLCMTSPPYWALRSYLPADHAAKALEMGSEPTPEAYIAGQVEVFRAVRRVLRDDGVIAINYGDNYAHSGQCGGASPDGPRRGRETDAIRHAEMGSRLVSGLKAKDLVGMPWRVALALQADGWYLRSAMPWVKRSAMPESVTDRPASAVEYVFLLAKSERYYWDAEAVKQTLSGPPHANSRQTLHVRPDGGERLYWDGDKDRIWGSASGRNFRNADLWFQSVKGPHGLCGVDDELVGLDVTAEPSREEHFAAYPSRLVEPFVKAGTSERGCCPECGAAWKRVVATDRERLRPRALEQHAQHANGSPQGGYRGTLTTNTLRWEPACRCRLPNTIDAVPWTPIPCTILDPFSGTGTSGVVACRHGRNYIGIELFEKYAAISERRIARALKPQTYRADVDSDSPLFAGDPS